MTCKNEVTEFLTAALAAGAAVEPPITTHISIVLRAGDRAWKLKRPVHLPYIDFSTPERRLAAAELEVELNRRTAPGLYRGVHRITRRPDGGLALDGDGPLVDAAVEMVRFGDHDLFDRMARDGRLAPALLTELAAGIAAFHAHAAVAPGTDGTWRLSRVLDLNARAFALAAFFPPAEVAALDAAFRKALEAQAPRLDARARTGRIRRCHGDLHLGNVCLFEGRPTLFDCIEFDEDIATVDVLYDLAFLLMDLWHRGDRAGANLVLNRYLDEADEEDGVALLPFFMALRAAIRAHILGGQCRGGAESEKAASARSYFALARALLAPAPARLVAVGGLSGSGKSTVAAGLAPDLGPAPGARILSSDRIRKRLYNVPAQARLPAAAYAPAVSRKVYARIAVRARRVLAQGHAVVADAVFDRRPDRDRMARVAGRAGVRFDGIWLEAPVSLLIERVEARRGDPSDATAQVVRHQAAQAAQVDDWPRLAAAGDPAGVRAAARRLAGLESGEGG